MKNLILVIGEKKYEFETKEELYAEVLGRYGESYHELSAEEKAKRRYEKAFINSKANPNRIKELATIPSIDLDVDALENFYIDTDDSYFLSLLNMGIVFLLETKESNEFTSDLDKENLSENYIIVNSFSPKLLKQEQDRIKSALKSKQSKEVSR